MAKEMGQMGVMLSRRGPSVLSTVVCLTESPWLQTGKQQQRLLVLEKCGTAENKESAKL